MIDITTLAIVVAIMVAFCIPFVHSYQKKKKHEKNLTKQFDEKASELGLNISNYDIWRRSYAIGLDSSQKKLLYIQFQPNFQYKLVDLNHVRRISISKEERQVGSDKDLQKVVDKLWLSLFLSNSPDVRLEFYDSDQSMGLMGEPVLIQKWHDLVKSVFSKNKEQLA